MFRVSLLFLWSCLLFGCCHATIWGIPNPGPRNSQCFLPYDLDSGALFGGENSETALNDVHLYNFSTNRWKYVSTFGISPSPRVYPICFVVNATLFVYGGYSQTISGMPADVDTDMYALELNSLTWTKQVSSPIQQGGASGVFVNGMLVVFGGQAYVPGMSYYSTDTCSNFTAIYHVAESRWVIWNGTVSPPARCFGGMAAIHTKAYLIGGMLDAPFSQGPIDMDVWEFNAITLEWTNLFGMGNKPSPRGLGFLVSNPITETLYYVTGTNLVQPFGDIYAFQNNSWSLFTTLSQATYQAAGFFMQNAIVLYGGFSGSVLSNQLLSISISTAQVQQLATIDDTLSTSYQRIWYASTSHNTKWYIYGGAPKTTSKALNDTLVLDLATFVWSTVTQYGAVPSARFSATLVTMDDVGVLFGGAAANGAMFFNDVHMLNFSTHTWTLVTAQNSPPTRLAHSSVVWRNQMVIFGGENCCTNFNDVWMLSFNMSLATGLWTQMNATNAPPARWFHCSTVSGDWMYIFGGYPAFNDIWALDLTKSAWIQLFPTNSPPVRNSAASVLLGKFWYINGGQGSNAQTLADTWAFNMDTQTWTNVQTLDLNTPEPAGAMQHQAIASPFADQLIIWGPGAPHFQTQVLSPGFHNISISSTDGSDVSCQLDESRPCQTFTFALKRFAGASYLEATVSADLRNSFYISSPQTLSNYKITVPVLIQGISTSSGVVLDCQGSSCFIVSNVLTNPFSLVNVVLRNAQGVLGGAIQATNSQLSLQYVTFENNFANQRGGAIYLQRSVLTGSNVTFGNNSAILEGGALYAYDQSTILMQNSHFYNNHAGIVGGAICIVETSMALSDSDFSLNVVLVSDSTSLSTLIGGGAIGATDCNVQLDSSQFRENIIQTPKPDYVTYGGAILSYSTSLSIRTTDFDQNIAGNGGALVSLAIPPNEFQQFTTVLTASILSLSFCLFSSNVASDTGGAIYVDSAIKVDSKNSRFDGNVAEQQGGAIYAASLPLILDGIQFNDNSCTLGNGAALFLLQVNSSISNSVFEKNASPQGGRGQMYWTGEQPTLFNIQATTSNLALQASPPYWVVVKNADILAQQQRSGSNFNQPIELLLLDYYNRTVTNSGLEVAISPIELFSGGTSAPFVNGTAVLDSLIIKIPSNSKAIISFSVPSTSLQTPTYEVQMAPVLISGDALVPVISPLFIIVGLVINGVMTWASSFSAQHYGASNLGKHLDLRSFVVMCVMFGFSSPVQIQLSNGALSFNALRISGASAAIYVDWTFVVVELVVSILCSFAAFGIVHTTFHMRSDRISATIAEEGLNLMSEPVSVKNPSASNDSSSSGYQYESAGQEINLLTHNLAAQTRDKTIGRRILLRFVLGGVVLSYANALGVYLGMLSITQNSGIVPHVPLAYLFGAFGLIGILIETGVIYWILRFYPGWHPDVLRPMITIISSGWIATMQWVMVFASSYTYQPISGNFQSESYDLLVMTAIILAFVIFFLGVEMDRRGISLVAMAYNNKRMHKKFDEQHKNDGNVALHWWKMAQDLQGKVELLKNRPRQLWFLEALQRATQESNVSADDLLSGKVNQLSMVALDGAFLPEIPNDDIEKAQPKSGFDVVEEAVPDYWKYNAQQMIELLSKPEAAQGVFDCLIQGQSAETWEFMLMVSFFRHQCEIGATAEFKRKFGRFLCKWMREKLNVSADMQQEVLKKITGKSVDGNVFDSSFHESCNLVARNLQKPFSSYETFLATMALMNPQQEHKEQKEQQQQHNKSMSNGFSLRVLS